MSNEIIDINKLMKDITDALGTRVAPLIRDIKEKRSGIPALTEKIQQKKRDIIEEQLKAENAAKAAEKEAEKEKESEPAPVLPAEKEEVRQKTADEEVSAPKTAETPAAEEKKIESKPQEKPVREKPIQDKSKTYINPEFLNGGDRRRQGGTQGGAQGERKFPPRTDGSAGGRQGGFDRRPGVGGRTQPVMPPPVSVSGGKSVADKKKKNGFAQKDEQKKSLSKRDLIKKGYVYEDGDDEDGDVRYKKQRKAQRDVSRSVSKIDHAEVNTDIIPIKVFSEKIGKTAAEIVKKLFDMGKMCTINDSIDFETAELIAIDYDVTLTYVPDVTAEDKLAQYESEAKENAHLQPRPPVVAIMGHVDHGKTSLLDYIRKTNVVKGEAGGITQHIGAYTIDLDGKPITFLDTPGHEAFTAMRQRGAQVTDIAIIVVAADDGIMPQTVEAINHAKNAGVQIIIAVNKIDKPGANIDRVKNQIGTYGLVPEDWGGDVYVCPVSAKLGTGVHELLECVLLVADIMELKADKDCMATGSIIEARLDKGLGPVATVLVQNGTLRVSDYVIAGTCVGKIRAMLDFSGKRVKEAGPSYAVQVQGFTAVPNAGDNLVAVKDAALARQVAEERLAKEKAAQQMKSVSQRSTLEELFKNSDNSEVKRLAMIIKGDVQGSVEAVKQAMLKLGEEMASKNIEIRVIHSAAGAINESDVMLADTSGAIIIGFNVKADAKARAMADRTGVEIRTYSVIYDAIDEVTNILSGMVEPIYEEEVIGHAEVREVFKITGVGNIAGCYVTDGKLQRGCKIRLVRDNIIIYNGVLNSLKREKDDAKEVAHGYECGVGLQKWGDIKKGDTIEAYLLKQVN